MTSIANLVQETSTSTGTGNFTLSTSSGRQSFNAAFGTGGTDVFYYFIMHRTAAEWEVGTGHMSDATTLVRDTVINSTNSNLAVNFSAGTKDITNARPATVVGAAAAMARVSGSTYSTIQHMQDIFHSAGLTTGGSITDDTDGTITVAAGTGLIRATDSVVAQLLWTDWSAESGANVALTDNDMNYVYVEYNAGSPRVIATTTKRTDTNTNIFLGTVYRSGTKLHITDSTLPVVGDHALRMIQRLKAVAPFQRASGGAISSPSGLKILVSAGTFWEGLTEFTIAAVDTSLTGTFSYWYRNGVGGWTEVASQTDINNTQYDNGTGTLATLSNNKYGVHWVYLEQDGELHVLYGQGDYTLAEAEDADIPASRPPHMDESHTRIVGKIIVLKSASTPTSIISAFDTSLSTGVSTDHGDLIGLGDDDHTQYALTSNGATAPGSAPQRVGEIYVDTVTDLAYVGTDTAGSGDFDRILVAGDIGGSVGDVVGPASSTDNAVTRFDATTGKLLQNSSVTIDDTGNVFLASGTKLDWNSGDVTLTHAANTLTFAGASSGYVFTDAILYVTSANPRLRLTDTDASSSYFEMTQGGSGTGTIFQLANTGQSLVDIVPLPVDGTSAANVRLFRSTNTTGSVSLDFCRGDGTGTLDHRIVSGTSGNSYFAANGGNVGIGVAVPGTKLSVVSASSGVQLTMSDSSTTATGKVARLGALHYTTTEEPVGVFALSAQSASSDLYIGGGSGVLNAATSIGFYTAANTTTTTGTERMRIDSSGNVGIGVASGGAKLDISGGSSSAAAINVRALSAATDNRILDVMNNLSTFRMGIEYDNTNVRMNFTNRSRVPLLTIVEANGNVGIGTTTVSGKCHIDQSSATGAVPVLYLDQADVSEEMIQFETTIGTGNAIEAVGAKTLTTTHFIKVTLPGGLTRYIPVGTIA